MDLPYHEKFKFIRNVDPQELVRYFNLGFDRELGQAAQKFAEQDFFYRGIFKISGRETMVWSVSGVDVCATVQPYDNSYIIGMNQCPQGLEPVNQPKQSGTR